jgi:DNA-binding transcriptional regulator YiaG
MRITFAGFTKPMRAPQRRLIRSPRRKGKKRILTAPYLPGQLRAWRKRNGLSQWTAAMALGMSKRTLQEWEHGRASPRGLTRTALEKFIFADLRPFRIPR